MGSMYVCYIQQFDFAISHLRKAHLFKNIAKSMCVSCICIKIQSARANMLRMNIFLTIKLIRSVFCLGSNGLSDIVCQFTATLCTRASYSNCSFRYSTCLLIFLTTLYLCLLASLTVRNKRPNTQSQHFG